MMEKMTMNFQQAWEIVLTNMT
uniref:Uncharacterized protein n=1 Tax=Megaselia scalaris TaxID=36166 RepID=T1GEB9_MEGSC